MTNKIINLKILSAVVRTPGHAMWDYVNPNLSLYSLFLLSIAFLTSG